MPSALKPRGSATRRAVAFEKATQNNRWVCANMVRAKSQFIYQQSKSTAVRGAFYVLLVKSLH